VDLVVKTIVCIIWIARNNCNFNVAAVLSVHALILKIGHLLLSWFSTSAEGPKKKVEDSMVTIRCSLDFLSPLVDEPGGASHSEMG